MPSFYDKGYRGDIKGIKADLFHWFSSLYIYGIGLFFDRLREGDFL